MNLQIKQSRAEAEKELAEVPKMQVLRLAQALPALPPETHGGSVDVVSLVYILEQNGFWNIRRNPQKGSSCRQCGEIGVSPPV